MDVSKHARGLPGSSDKGSRVTDSYCMRICKYSLFVVVQSGTDARNP